MDLGVREGLGIIPFGSPGDDCDHLCLSALELTRHQHLACGQEEKHLDLSVTLSGGRVVYRR